MLPDHTTVKVDALLAFNQTHQELHRITRAVAGHGGIVNALTDAPIDDHGIFVGVEVKGETVDAAPATAVLRFVA